MSLPERLYRIAKHKIGEIKDHIDQMGEDAELDPEVVEKRRKAQGARSPGAAGQTTPQADPLEPHYRLLGIDAGADLPAVQAAYKQKLARLDSLATPQAGSEEARQAQALRERFDAAYQSLKEALDPTSRRFDLLEI